MTDYTEIIYVSVAMVVFSLLTVNTARSFRMTDDMLIRADLEYRAVALAQDVIDNIRWEPDEDKLDPNDNEYIFSGYPATYTLTYGESDEYSEEFTIDGSSELIESTAAYNKYKVTVTASSDALSPEISATLEYIKTYSQ